MPSSKSSILGGRFSHRGSVVFPFVSTNSLNSSLRMVGSSQGVLPTNRTKSTTPTLQISHTSAAYPSSKRFTLLLRLPRTTSGAIYGGDPQTVLHSLFFPSFSNSAASPKSASFRSPLEL